MQIGYTASGDLQLKTKTETVTMGAGLRIGSKVIPGPGEYDVASIQCEGMAIDGTVAYFIRTEDLMITFLTGLDGLVTKLEDISDTAILVADVRSDDTPEAAKKIIKALEPYYVFLIGAGATPDFIAKLELPQSEDSTLKITRAGLPLEGTTIIPNR